MLKNEVQKFSIVILQHKINLGIETLKHNTIMMNFSQTLCFKVALVFLLKSRIHKKYYFENFLTVKCVFNLLVVYFLAVKRILFQKSKS